MSDGDLSDQIARIESDIEQLAETLDGCRKAMLFSKVVITAGGIWILAYFLGAIRFDPMAMIASIAAIIGGVVVFGSNSSTSKQAMAAMKVAETQRAELIDMIGSSGGARESAGTALKTLIQKGSLPRTRPNLSYARPAFFDPSSVRSGVKSMGPGIACPFEISGRAADVTN
jgi:hypothetical protein